MEQQEHLTMHAIEENHWWFFGKRRIFSLFWKKYASGKKVLDIGCGGGKLIQSLKEQGFEVAGMDYNREAVESCLKRGLENIRQGNLEERIPFDDHSFDAVVALDIVEHIKNEEKAFEEIRRVLKPGGRCFLSVPAYRFLWSYHDKFLHHQRRYSKKHLVEVSRGFKIKKMTYTNMFIFPLILIIRPLRAFSKAKSSDVRPTNQVFNFLLKGFYLVETFLLKFISLPFGTSIFAVLESC